MLNQEAENLKCSTYVLRYLKFHVDYQSSDENRIKRG